ncbi:MAG: DUF2004 domain-containing protein [Spirochaetes bacterium]|nr:DUF2004 domain-containing protein [Spirochaetota bacterium]
MKTFDFNPFGMIPQKGHMDYYDSTLIVNGYPVAVDLNIEPGADISLKSDLVKMILKESEKIRTRCIENILCEFKIADSGRSPRLYFDHHREELADPVKISLFQKKNPTEVEFSNVMILKRIGIYLNIENEHTRFDFSLPGNATQYVLSCIISNSLKIMGIEMES